MRRPIRNLLRMFVLIAVLSPAAAVAETSLLIWPLDPTIEAGQKAGVLWLENVGKAPVTLQVRVLGWEQADFEDRHDAQDVIVATPPFATVAPGQKQLVRFTLIVPPAAGEERAFRVIVDEIPGAMPVSNSNSNSNSNAGMGTGLRLQMRYSLPLFAYGEGLWRKQRGRVNDATRAEPQLAWRLVEEGGKRYVQVRNAGRGHARLSRVRLVASPPGAPGSSGADIEVANGLLGYVLPGRVMRWPVQGNVSNGHQLQVQLEANAPTQTLTRE